MKRLSILILLVLINTVIVRADYKEAEVREASANSFTSTEYDKDTVQRVSVRAAMPSTYTISIPKESDSEVYITVNGDIAGNERVHLIVDNMSKYINWNEMGTTFRFNKVSKSMNYKIILEEVC